MTKWNNGGIIIHAIRLFSAKYGKKSLTHGEQTMTKGASVSTRFVKELKTIT